MTIRILTALFAVSLLFIAGCADDEPTAPDPGGTAIRLLHNVYDGGALDVRVDGKVVISGVTYNSSSGYKSVTPTIAPDQADVSVHYAGDPDPRNSSKQTLGEGLVYTVYAFPPAAAFSAGFQNDPRETGTDKARIKFVNATSDTFKYELYVTGSKTRLMGPINRTQVNQYIDVFAGSYAFSIRKQGDTAFSLEYDAVTLLPQGAYTIVMHGTQRDDDSYPFKVRMYTDNGEGKEYLDWNRAASIGKLSYVNSIIGSTPVDVAVDGSVRQVTGLGYGTATSNLTFAAGDHTYTVVSGNTALLSDQSITLASQRSYSVFLTGLRNPLDVQPLTLENVTAPNATQALVRFVNLAPDAPAIEIGVKELSGYVIPMASTLGYRQVSSSATTGSAFLTLPPGTYTLQYIDAATKTVLLEQPNQVFAAGLIYTNWLGGTTASRTLKAYNVNHN